MPRNFFSYPLQDPKKERKPVVAALVHLEPNPEKNTKFARCEVHSVGLGLRGVPENKGEKK